MTKSIAQNHINKKFTEQMSAKKPKLQNNPLAWMTTKKVELQGIRLSDVQYVSPTQLKPNPLNNDFFRDESEDYFDKLRSDVKERGIIVPLLAKKDDTLLAGHNRLRVAKELGLENIPVQYVLDVLPEKSEREFIIKDNLYRRHFSTSEWIHLYKKLYPDFDELISQETRGGGLKWAKVTNNNEKQRNKTERSVLLAPNEIPTENRLTAQKIANDTGQKLSAVQKQLTKYRKEKSQKNTSTGATARSSSKTALNTNETKSPLLFETQNLVTAIEKSLKSASKQDIQGAIKKLEALRNKLEKLL